MDSCNWFARSIRKCLLSDGRDYLRLLINVAAFIRHTATLPFFPETFRGLELLKWTDSNKSLLLFIKMNIFRDGLLVWKGFNQWLTAKCEDNRIKSFTPSILDADGAVGSSSETVHCCVNCRTSAVTQKLNLPVWTYLVSHSLRWFTTSAKGFNELSRPSFI